MGEVEWAVDTIALNLSCIMLQNDQTYFKNRKHRKIFKVRLAILQHYAWKG